jgi:Protein of unknown function (DUF3515)
MTAVAGCATDTLGVAVPSPPSNAITAACARLGDQLPSQIEGLNPRLTHPRSPLVHAWGNRPVVLRCGVPLPSGYSAHSAAATTVNGVLWYQQIEGARVVWTTVRKLANVELTVPTSYAAQGGFLVDLAAPIQTALP